MAEARRPTAQEQEAQALARLSLPDLRNYFEARRQIERRSSDLRLAQLRNLEDCLQRTRQRVSADACLEQARVQRERDRAQWIRDLAALRRRYQLPVLDDR
jgi:ubiquinone biosynthesis protein COQ9